MGRRAIATGAKEAPYAFVIPAGQADGGAVERLVDVLRVGRVEVGQARTAFSAGGKSFAPGSYVVRLDQPYRAHAKDLLEVQRFPKMEQWPGGPPERPYDVAGWTLPLQMGVTVVRSISRLRRDEPRDRCCRSCRVLARPRARWETARPRAIRAHTLPNAAAAWRLYKSWTANMDEGWTRWVMDDFKFPYISISDSVVRAGGFESSSTSS
jgi:hypothetical protein